MGADCELSKSKTRVRYVEDEWHPGENIDHSARTPNPPLLPSLLFVSGCSHGLVGEGKTA